MVFNERKVYKDLLTERSTPEKDLGIEQSTTEQQSSATDSKFVEIDDIPIENSWSILEENEKSRVEPPTPQSEVRRSTMQTKASKRYFPFSHYLLWTDSDNSSVMRKPYRWKPRTSRSLRWMMRWSLS